jgi:Predicted membrane protein (DUF2306)
MTRIFQRPMTLALLLFLATFIPIISAPLRIFQVLTDQLPPDAIRFNAVPWALFLHSLGGMTFGLLGPIQFSRAIKSRFGKFHRISGRIFVLTGMMLALSALRLLVEFPNSSTWVLVTARAVAGLGLMATLTLALIAIMNRDIAQHRNWMIRAYAIGMGAATIAFIQLPIFLIRGKALEGYFADSLFVLSWVINLTIAELVIRFLRAKIKVAQQQTAIV